ncbi:MerR family transcriptional regulator [Rhodoligotrophos defluvii]|uniref:MerR family transcriptional regulator n=1 Tax=Rhodoligotrophos defluvii TaxID=2561934 RepID=UPI001485208D|nr:MerR family transcriptional regulator [Rhodoligotrophos defluvii]
MSAVKTFRVAEVAKLVGVSPSTLRLWENHGLVAPFRTEGEHRVYRDSDVERVREINRLRKVQRLNIAAIRAVLNTAGNGSDDRSAPPPALGPKVKALRQRAGLTLKQVSARTGLPISLISTLERTSGGASMASLMALATCYGTPITDLLAPPQETVSRVVKAGRARRVPILGPLIQVEQLAEGRTKIDCQRWTLAPGAASEGSYAHEGEEFIHVLAGMFEITLGSDELHRLSQGDSIYFPSTVIHAWRNPGGEAAVLLWISTPRTF